MRDVFWQKEFDELIEEVKEVFRYGATKHGDNSSSPNFLEKDGYKCTLNESSKCALNHVAEGYYGHEKDLETGCHPFAHAIANLMMRYTRTKRGIVHPRDEES